MTVLSMSKQEFSRLDVLLRVRPVALGRKNALFAGADSGGEHWALVATLIQTAKLNLLDPLAWLTDVLERIVSGRTQAERIAHAAAVELEVWKPTAGDQLGLAVK